MFSAFSKAKCIYLFWLDPGLDPAPFVLNCLVCRPWGLSSVHNGATPTGYMSDEHRNIFGSEYFLYYIMRSMTVNQELSSISVTCQLLYGILVLNQCMKLQVRPAC